MNRPKAIIVDLDGTICNIRHRLHHIEKEGKKDWDSFNQDIPFDEPKQNIIDLVRMYHGAGIKIILVTGRFEKYSHSTLAWLNTHNVKWDHIHMRNDGDYRSDYVVKHQKYENFIKGGYDILFVLDDRDSVVNMWREQGLTCLQVQKGDY